MATVSGVQGVVHHPVGNNIPTVPISEVEKHMEVAPGAILRFFIKSISETAVKNESLLKITFSDEVGEPVSIPNWPSISPKIGQYRYLTTGALGETAMDSFEIVAPKAAVSLRVQGMQWKKETFTKVVDDLAVWDMNDEDSPLELPTGEPLRRSSKRFVQRIEVPHGASAVSLHFDYVPHTKDGVVPITFEAVDANGNRVVPIGSFPINEKIGQYITLGGGEEAPHTKVVDVPVTPKTERLILRGVDWGRRHATLLGPAKLLDTLEETAVVLEEFLDDVPESAPLVIIDTTAPPLGHETLSLRPNNLTVAYGHLGMHVIFVPFSSTRGKPLRHGQRTMQVPREEFPMIVDRVSHRREGRQNVYICSSFPNVHSVAAAAYLRLKGWKVVYEARDDMEEFNRVGYSKWYAPALEREILKLADTTVSVSTSLDEKLSSLYPNITNNHVNPNAVNRSVIDNSAPLRSLEAMRERNASQMVGYVGHLTDSWFDWTLLIEAANALQDVTFEIVGHGMPSGLAVPDNIDVLGPKTHDELATIVDRWKVGIIPFADLPLTRSVDPNKIYEYFAWGLRCVTAPMGSVDEYPSTWVYRSDNEFIENIREALDTDFTPNEIQTMEEFVQSSGWDDRAREMVDLLEIKLNG